MQASVKMAFEPIIVREFFQGRSTRLMCDLSAESSLPSRSKRSAISRFEERERSCGVILLGLDSASLAQSDVVTTVELMGVIRGRRNSLAV